MKLYCSKLISLLLSLNILILMLMIFHIYSSSCSIKRNTLHEAIGTLALARQNFSFSKQPFDALLMKLGNEQFSDFSYDDKIIFLTYNALNDDNSVVGRSILIELAVKNKMVHDWQYELERIGDNSCNDIIKNKCIIYINLLKQLHDE